MTAVFAPDPKSLGSTVDVLLWFHGHKGMLGNLNLSGFSAQKYLTVAQFKLREFVSKSTKKNFLLVVPTLDDTSEAGLLEKADEANAFLQQAVNAPRNIWGPRSRKSARSSSAHTLAAARSWATWPSFPTPNRARPVCSPRTSMKSGASTAPMAGRQDSPA